MPRKSTRDIKPDVADQDVYVIKSILEYERRKGADYYLVEWLGYPVEQATWEPRSNFVDPDVETLERLTSLKAQYLEDKKKPSVGSSPSTQSNGTTASVSGKPTASLDVSKTGSTDGLGALSYLRRVSTQDPAPSKRRASRLSNGSTKRARTMTAFTGPEDKSSGIDKPRQEEDKGHMERPSSDVSIQDEKDNKEGDEDLVSSEASISATHRDGDLPTEQETAPATASPDLPIADPGATDIATSSQAAEAVEDQPANMPPTSHDAVVAPPHPNTNSAPEQTEDDALSARRSRLRRLDFQDAPAFSSSPTTPTQAVSEENDDSVPTGAAVETRKSTEPFTSPTKPVQSETTDPVLPAKPSSKEPSAHVSPLQPTARDTAFSPRTTSNPAAEVASDSTSAPREQPKIESALATTNLLDVEKKESSTTPGSPTKPQSSITPTGTVVQPSAATSPTESMASSQEPVNRDAEKKAVGPVIVEQIRVKSLRQDDTYGLCGTITRTNSLGEVEESRLPISEVRRRYPEELIDFLLQRIQFRSIRCSLGSNSAAGSAVATPNS